MKVKRLSFGDQDRGPFIDLLEYEEKGDRTPLGPRDIGIPRFALIVEDVDEAYDELCAKGFEPLGKPVTFQTGHVTQRAFYVKDPDGVLVTLEAFVRPRA